MSGFTKSSRYGTTLAFELTATKANYWHGACRTGTCRSGELRDIVETHAVPGGFTVLHDGGAFIALSGPGIAARSTDTLYEAISGRPSRRR